MADSRSLDKVQTRSSLATDQQEAPQKLAAEVNSDRAYFDEVNTATASITSKTTTRQTFQSSTINAEYDEADKLDHTSESKNYSQLFVKFIKRCLKYLRPDFLLNHLDLESFKIALRTFFGIFVSILFITIRPSLHYIGAAVFLSAIVSCIEVSGNVSISHAFITGFLDISIAFLAFSLTTIGHAIGWRLKGYQTKESVVKELAEKGICKIGDTQCLLHEIFSGRFLNTKASVIMTIAMMSSFMICGWLSTKSLVFMIPWVLSAITTCVTGLYLNLLPFFDPWRFGRVIFVPVGFSLAVRFVLAIIWFPFTSNSKFITMLCSILDDTSKTLKNNKNHINELRPSDPEFDKEISTWSKHTLIWVKKFFVLPMLSMFSKVEVAFGVMDPHDLSEMQYHARTIIESLMCDRYFYKLIVEKRHRIERHVLAEVLEPGDGSEIPPVKNRFPKNSLISKKLNKEYAKVGYWDNFQFQKFENLITDEMSVDDLNQIYESVINIYGDTPDLVSTLLDAVVVWLNCINEARIYTRLIPPLWKKHVKKRLEASEALQKAYDALDESLKSYQSPGTDPRNKFDPEVKSNSYRPFAFEMASFYGCCLKRLASDVRTAAKFCLELNENKKKPKFIFPFTHSHFLSSIMESNHSQNGVDVDNGEMFYSTTFDPTSDVQARDPESSPPRTVWHLIGARFKQGLGFIYNETFLYCLKRATAVMLSSLTFMSRRTSLFSYNCRIVWTPVMVALTTTNIALDAGYNFYWRLYYTVAGCIAGIVCWYVGNGHGEGNPYGFTVSLSAVMFFMTFYRHFHQHLIPTGAIILLVTTVLVSSIGWIDNAHIVTSSVGAGWKAGWIRFVTVIVGLSIALIASLFPRPKTARRQVRINMGKGLESLLEIHATISKFAMQRSKNSSIHIKPKDDHIKNMIQSFRAMNLQTRMFTSQIVYEPSISGIWPKHRYELLLKFIEDSVILLESIYHFLNVIEDPENILVALQRMGWTNIEITTTMCSVMSMSSRALAIPLPLPSMTPPSISVMYGKLLDKIEFDIQEYNRANQKDGEGESDDLYLKRMFEELYKTSDGRHIMALITTCSSFYARLDGCLRIVKGLVGESFGVDKDMFEFDIESAPLLKSSGFL